jgi:hypothetical protein
MVGTIKGFLEKVTLPIFLLKYGLIVLPPLSLYQN